MEKFKPLFDDENYEASPSPVLMANTSQDRKSVNRQTTEAPCESEDSRPMKADSFHHRSK